ncbi:ribosomal protein L11 methyltransferase [Desulfocicer vacuolatum DSM 3385]|uniref:Ribosomal protein L11 methyltransferase n=1 Tax=Desulfocicer vacuolatum DSM 3385 TaxID=1121400 RepID=A0A1W1ZTM3_9BACT|nr:50S ribosomal protein L11 methyltransferase [Desulfocicer vacuolatum]SMC51428.1 ribosomal protein L11 methyltransferase [Desulfocicer vacuolatum DSM 3385]
MSPLLEYIHTTVTEAETRLTPQALIKQTTRDRGVSTRQARSAIRTLLDNGTLSYTYVFGATCIEPSFAKPVEITKHFTLFPPGVTPDEKKNNIHICIQPGISFGSGRHPTTRLCLRAMGHALIDTPLLQSCETPHHAVDVGTGSGVLAIAAVKAGISHCFALDNDPVAAAEAEKNVSLNHLSHGITVSCEELKASATPLAMVCANLRYPTLKSMADLFRRITLDNAVLILSGIRPEELPPLVALYGSRGFTTTWQAQEKNWSGAVMVKTG